ncbi:MAG: Nif3-like dinuclear metal center hexameric protein [Candidatus Limisoma sp.]
MRIRSVLDAIESLAHRTLQESYDNSGLQAGDVALDCSGVLLTLDVTEQTVDEAIERNLNLIISHHPLLFKPVKQISPDSAVGRILMKAIRHGIAIYSAHTSLDNAWGGVSHRMAEMLGMTDIRVLEPQSAMLAKVVVFVPTDYADTVANAMFAAGAGHIGDYDSCSYRMQGMGSFRALDAAQPFVGNIGEIHNEPETRIEVIARRSNVDRIVSAMLKVHPYEEPAFDIIALDNADNRAGSGVVGCIEESTLAELLTRLKDTFRVPAIRYSGNDTDKIRRVALCGGSGAFLIGNAIAAGADIFVTGDLKYHDFTTYAERIAIADIGHYESEQCAKQILADIIKKNFPDLLVSMAESDTNTIKYI